MPIAALDSAIMGKNLATLTYEGAHRTVIPMQRGYLLGAWWYFCWQVSQVEADDDDEDADDDPIPWWRTFREDKITDATMTTTGLPWPEHVFTEFTTDLNPFWPAESIALDVRDYITGFWPLYFGFTP